MGGIVGHGPTPQHGQNPGAAPRRIRQGFQHQHRCAFAQIQPIAILVEGTAGFRVQGLQRIETAQRERTQRIASSCQNHRGGLIEQHIGG